MLLGMLTKEEVAAQREAGKILAEIMMTLAMRAEEGATPRDLDRIAAQLCAKHGVEATCLGYKGFPANLCVSVNHQIVHGVPHSRAFKDGDLVKLDMAVTFGGMIADTAVTVAVGRETQSSNDLRQGTLDSLFAGIAKCRALNTNMDVADAIWSMAVSHGLSMFEQFGGHGVGRKLHDEPFMPNIPIGVRPNVLTAGTSVAIEPIATFGNTDNHNVQIGADGWTYSLKDRSLSAHFEHTIYVGDAPEVLTAWPKGAVEAILGLSTPEGA